MINFFLQYVTIKLILEKKAKIFGLFHSVLCFSLGAGASVSLLAEADKLDTLGLDLLDRGLVTLRWVVLEHKPGVGGHRGGLRGALTTETMGGMRRGGQG